MRALVLAGGGSRGSHQAGMLVYMGEVVDRLWPGGFELVSGTSVGNINGAGIAMFPPDKFAEATKYVASMWRQHMQKTSDVWKLRFPIGIPALWNPSVGVNGPLEKLLAKLVNIDALQSSGVQFRMTSVDMITGDLVTHTQEDLVKYGIKPLLASASYPLAFPPVEIGDQWLSDGGIRDTAPVGAAIEAGADEIVVITTRDPYKMDPKPRAEMGNVAEFGLRCLSLMFHEGVQSDVKMAEAYNKLGKVGDTLRKYGVEESLVLQIVNELGANKKVVKLTVLYPLETQGPSLDFSGEQMNRQLDQGYKDAKALLAHLLDGDDG